MLTRRVGGLQAQGLNGLAGFECSKERQDATNVGLHFLMTAVKLMIHIVFLNPVCTSIVQCGGGGEQADGIAVSFASKAAMLVRSADISSDWQENGVRRNVYPEGTMSTNICVPESTKRRRLARLRVQEQGQSLLEFAVILPVLYLLISFAVDFGYYFIVAAGITSSSRNAVEYSIQGFSSPAAGYSSTTQPSPPAAGSTTTSGSVAALAVGDLSSFLYSTTETTVQVCSSTVTSTGAVSCQTWGATSQSWTPDTDPESPLFHLYRVDVLYHISPPLPVSIFGYSLVPSYSFHHMAEMRGMN